MHYPLVYYRLADTSISRSRIAMIQKHWMLYSDYFAGSRLRAVRRMGCMASYAALSVLRLIAEKVVRVR